MKGRNFLLAMPMMCLLGGPTLAEVLADHPPWLLSRVPDEKYGAGFGCKLTLTAEGASLDMTAYFLGADIEVRAERLALVPHAGTLNLYIPAVDSTMSVSGAEFDGKTIRARGGEQVMLQMLEAVSAAEASEIIIFDGEVAVGGFKSAGLSRIMPMMRDCFAGL